MPAERLDDAVATLVRVALGRRRPLGRRPPRDVATTRRGGLGYALLRLAPRSLVDRLTGAAVRRALRRGHFDDAAIATTLREAATHH